MDAEQKAPNQLQVALQSTLFWGCIGAVMAIVLMVIAAMMHDVRWVLAFAWPFAVFAAWEFARTCLDRKTAIWIATGIAAVVSGAFLGWLYFALAPAEPVVVKLPSSEPVRESAPQKPVATPTPAKPRLASTYKKMILICDLPRSGKTLSKKEKQAEWNRYADVMEKIFGYSVKSTVGDDELTLAVTPKQAELSPTYPVMGQTFFIKRSGDQLFVTITNEVDNVFGLIFALAIVDPEEAVAKQIIEKVEQLVHAQPGKCKFV
jgi:hypothetical protein